MIDYPVKINPVNLWIYHENKRNGLFSFHDPCFPSSAVCIQGPSINRRWRKWGSTQILSTVALFCLVGVVLLLKLVGFFG